MPAQVVLDFASDLARVLSHQRPDLVGVYLHGSAALGGFTAARSDVDILVIVKHSTDAAVQRRLGDAIAEAARDCPGIGLELSVITAKTAQDLGSCQYEVHVNTTGTDAVIVTGDEDTDLILHSAVCREHAVAVTGPPSGEVFGEIPRDRIIQATRDELEWALEHAPTTYTVLNACRAQRFVLEGIQCSKVEAGEWYLSRHPESSVVRSALEFQRGATTSPPDATQTQTFVRKLFSL